MTHDVRESAIRLLRDAGIGTRDTTNLGGSMKRYGLTRLESGSWATPSGRFLVESDVNYENECECIHCLDSRREDCRSTVKGQRADRGWHVWDEHEGDYAAGSGYQTFATMRDAAEFALSVDAIHVGSRVRVDTGLNDVDVERHAGLGHEATA